MPRVGSRRPTPGHGYRDCVTVTVCPATVSVPLRRFGFPVYCATAYVTVPLALPGVPPVTVIQDALLVAVQLQPAPAVTETFPVVAAAPKDARAGAIEYVHAAAASWFTVNVWPATVIVPVRDWAVLTSTE